MQRTATPLTPVRFRPQPPFPPPYDNSPSLSPGGEIGRRKGLKIPRLKGRAGSIPAPGTKQTLDSIGVFSIWRIPCGSVFVCVCPKNDRYSKASGDRLGASAK